MLPLLIVQKARFSIDGRAVPGKSNPGSSDGESRAGLASIDGRLLRVLIFVLSYRRRLSLQVGDEMVKAGSARF